MSNALHAMYLIILIINLKVTLLWAPFYRWENWGSKRLTVLSKVTQLVRTVTRSQAALISELLFLSQCTLKGLKQLIREESKLVCWEWRSLDCVSVQFSSVTQSCPTLYDPVNRSTPGLPVHHQLPEFTQTHIHQVSDAIQPSHPLSSLSPPAPNPSQHQGLFQWVRLWVEEHFLKAGTWERS